MSKLPTDSPWLVLYDGRLGGTPDQQGKLRDYTAFEGPVNPYRTPNVIFLGDNTTSAQARIKLAYVAVLPAPGTA